MKWNWEVKWIYQGNLRKNYATWKKWRGTLKPLTGIYWNILGNMPPHEGTWRNVTGHAEKWRDHIETPQEKMAQNSEILQTHAKIKDKYWKILGTKSKMDGWWNEVKLFKKSEVSNICGKWCNMTKIVKRWKRRDIHKNVNTICKKSFFWGERLQTS